LIITLLKTFLLPPALQLGLMLLALLLWRWFKKTACCLLIFSWLSLAALSMPAVSAYLFQWLEAPYVKQSFELDDDVGAIVVLGGGRLRNPPEYGGEDQPGYHALWRLRFAGRLANQYQLPVIVSGGTVYPYETISEAAIGAKFLREEMQVSEVWEEGESRDTWQNARNSIALLKEKEIQKVAVVTHAYHMRRAEIAFRRANANHVSPIEVVPMPTMFFSVAASGWWDDLLPTSYGLLGSRVALHEYLGLAFYSWRQN
jgi:uncharacterized SAM-binding protein YcdF (DUF218 family)